jgi:hypothetical protein
MIARLHDATVSALALPDASVSACANRVPNRSATARPSSPPMSRLIPKWAALARQAGVKPE